MAKRLIVAGNREVVVAEGGVALRVYLPSRDTRYFPIISALYNGVNIVNNSSWDNLRKKVTLAVDFLERVNRELGTNFYVEVTYHNKRIVSVKPFFESQVEEAVPV